MKAIAVLDDNQTWSGAEGARIILVPEALLRKYEDGEDLEVDGRHLSDEPKARVVFVADLLFLLKTASKSLKKLPRRLQDAVRRCG